MAMKHIRWHQRMDEAGIGHIVTTNDYADSQVYWVHGTSGNVTPLAEEMFRETRDGDTRRLQDVVTRLS